MKGSVMPAHPPNLLANVDAWMRISDPSKLGLVLDFDGTISELVPVPDDATLHPDVAAPLCSLASKLGLTAVMSGRPARDVENRVGMEPILYIGNHGAEHLFDGCLTQAPQATEPLISPEDLVARLKPTGDGPGLVWEVKQFSLAIHYRMSPDKAQARLALQRAVEAVPEIQDMEVISGNMVLEIRGRNGVNKGSAMEKLVREHELQSLFFLGDDTTDVDALIALRKLTDAGAVSGVGVAVIQDGTPEPVLDNADYSLEGVAEVVKFLRMLDEATA